MNLLQFYYSVKYTRFVQLFYRLKFSLQRTYSYLLRDYYKKKLKVNSVINLSAKLPSPIFPQRRGIINKSGSAYQFTFLNKNRSFVVPINWFPGESELWNMQLHYMEYLEEADDSDFQILIENWINNNPPYMKNYGTTNWSSYSLSIRALVWMQQYALRSDRLKSEFKRKILISLIEQLNFLSKNLELDIVGNHLIKNLKTLLWAGRFFNSHESEEWRKKAEDLLTVQLDEQILQDGMHFELSTAYHCQVFADLVECYTVLQNNKLHEKLYVILNKMAQVIANMSFPDDTISLFNDGGLEMTYQPGVCLSVWERISGNRFFPEKIFSLKDSGYFGIHNKNYDIIIDAGKVAPDYLPAHSHGDIFSFELCYNAKRFIIDPGVFEYTSGPRRSYSRATKSHNTVNLDGKDQCEFYGSFRLARRASVTVENFTKSKDGLILTGFHDGYKRLSDKPIHKRKFEINSGVLEVYDEIINGNGQKVESRLLLHPDCTYELSGNQIIIYRDIDFIIIETTSKISIEDALWFPDFGREEKTSQIVFNYGNAPVSSSFRILLPDITNKKLMDKELFNNLDTIERAK